MVMYKIDRRRGGSKNRILGQPPAVPGASVNLIISKNVHVRFANSKILLRTPE